MGKRVQDNGSVIRSVLPGTLAAGHRPMHQRGRTEATNQNAVSQLYYEQGVHSQTADAQASNSSTTNCAAETVAT